MTRPKFSARRALRLVPVIALTVATGLLAISCASENSNSEWKGDDGGYGGTGRFNPVGAEAGSSDQFKSSKSGF